MNAHTFLITTRALAVAVVMEVQEGKVASAEASKEAALTASPDEEMIQEVFRHGHLCSSQKAL